MTFSTLQPRFLKKFRIDSSGCWEWTAGRDQDGYGRFWWTPAGNNVFAHRFAYEALVGTVPDGLQIDHLCRNRACVNVEHMEVVTGRVNTLRGIAPTALNASKTQCPRGHPFSGDNLYLHPLKGGSVGRDCRECNRVRAREYQRRKREVAYG